MDKTDAQFRNLIRTFWPFEEEKIDIVAPYRRSGSHFAAEHFINPKLSNGVNLLGLKASTFLRRAYLKNFNTLTNSAEKIAAVKSNSIRIMWYTIRTV